MKKQTLPLDPKTVPCSTLQRENRDLTLEDLLILDGPDSMVPYQRKTKEPTKPKKAKRSNIIYSQIQTPPLLTGQAPVYYNGKEVIFEVRIVED